MTVKEENDTLTFTISGGKQIKCIPATRLYTLNFKDVEDFEEVIVTINGTETPASYGKSFVNVEDITVEDEITVTLKGVTVKKNKPVRERALDCLIHLNGNNMKKVITNKKLNNCETEADYKSFIRGIKAKSQP